MLNSSLKQRVYKHTMNEKRFQVLLGRPEPGNQSGGSRNAMDLVTKHHWAKVF